MILIPRQFTSCFALLLILSLVTGCGASSGGNQQSTQVESRSGGQLAITPLDISFGSVAVGNSQSQTGTLIAGKSSVTVSTASWNGTGFSLSGISFPVTIPEGKKVPFTVTFAPQAGGSVLGTISFLSNATNSPTDAQLSGNGVPRIQHGVKIDWLLETSTVHGYYVYRGGQTRGPYTRISSLEPGPAYTDSTVMPGHTYYYIVTVVGTNSLESSYSNEVRAVIPAP